MGSKRPTQSELEDFEKALVWKIEDGSFGGCLPGKEMAIGVSLRLEYAMAIAMPVDQTSFSAAGYGKIRSLAFMTRSFKFGPRLVELSLKRFTEVYQLSRRLHQTHDRLCMPLSDPRLTPDFREAMLLKLWEAASLEGIYFFPNSGVNYKVSQPEKLLLEWNIASGGLDIKDKLWHVERKKQNYEKEYTVKRDIN